MTSIYSRLGEFVTDIGIIFSEWNEHVYVFNEQFYQLSGYARADWASRYAPIPPLKGLKTTTQNAKLVLVTIAQHSNKEYGGAWPGVGTISEETGLSKRAVRYTLDALQALGLIEEAPHLAKQCPKYLRLPADKRPRFYTVNFVLDKRIVTDEYRQWADEQLDELRRKRVRRSGASGTTTDERGATQNRAGCNVEHERGATQNTTGCNAEQSGVQRVAANKNIKTNINTNILKKIENKAGTPAPAFYYPTGEADEQSTTRATDLDRASAAKLFETNSAFKELAREVALLQRGTG